MSKMTKAQAQAEAKRRWGPEAWVELHPGGYTGVIIGVSVSIEGIGSTWEDAFEDADKRREKERS